ncbi:MAG: hypothetical protein AAFP68_04615 [Pseudomonadota bacterium]
MKRIAIVIALMFTTMVAASAFAEDDEDHDAFLETVDSYLEISEKFIKLADRKEAAVFFAVEGIVEIYDDRGEQANAVPALVKILDQYPDNQTVRNIVRFKLRDVYRETGMADRALAELEAVIAENR